MTRLPLFSSNLLNPYVMVDVRERSGKKEKSRKNEGGHPRHLDRTVAIRGNVDFIKKIEIIYYYYYDFIVYYYFNKTLKGNNPKWCYNNKFQSLVNRCTEITFSLFQESSTIAEDDDWLAEGTFLTLINTFHKKMFSSDILYYHRISLHFFLPFVRGYI